MTKRAASGPFGTFYHHVVSPYLVTKRAATLTPSVIGDILISSVVGDILRVRHDMIPVWYDILPVWYDIFPVWYDILQVWYEILPV